MGQEKLWGWRLEVGLGVEGYGVVCWGAGELS